MQDDQNNSSQSVPAQPNTDQSQPAQQPAPQTPDLGNTNVGTTTTPTSQVTGSGTTESNVGNAATDVNSQVGTGAQIPSSDPAVAGTTPGDQTGGVVTGTVGNEPQPSQPAAGTTPNPSSDNQSNQ